MAGGCGECVPLSEPCVPFGGDVAGRRIVRVSRILRSRRIPLVPFGPAALESCTSPRPGIRRRLDVGVGHADLSPAGRSDHDRAPVAPADGLDRSGAPSACCRAIAKEVDRSARVLPEFLPANTVTDGTVVARLLPEHVRCTEI